MIKSLESTGGRLQVRLAAWVLAASIVPLIVVGAVVYVVLTYQHVVSLQHEQSLLADTKGSLFMSYVGRITDDLQIALRTTSVIDVTNTEAVIQRLSEAMPVTADSYIFLMGFDGAITAPPTRSLSIEIVPRKERIADESVILRGDQLFISTPLPNGTGWLVAVRPLRELQAIMYQGINPARFYTPGEKVSNEYGLGTTGDIFIIGKSDGVILPSLLDRPLNVVEFPAQFRSWMGDRKGRYVDSVVINKIPVIIHAQPILDRDNEYVIAITLDRSDFLQSWYQQQRNLVTLYLVALMLVLIILYVFVASTNTTIVKPLQRSVRAIDDLMHRFADSSTATQQGMQRNVELAKTLEARSHEQLSVVQSVEGDVRTITESISKTAQASRSLARTALSMDQIAKTGEAQAQQAEASIESIKRISTTNQMLASTLQQYAQEVSDVSTQVQSIGDALQFFTVNASIQATKSTSAPQLASMVEEVHKLSVVASIASASVQKLVEKMQQPLRDTLQGVTEEVHNAEDGLRTITEAAENLRKLSRTALTMSTSIQSIDTALRVQDSQTTAVQEHMKALATSAQSNLDQVTNVTSLVDAMGIVVQESASSVAAVERAVTSLSALLNKKRS